MYRMERMNIDWNQFKYQNKNLNKDFENMARLLFAEVYCKTGETLHSNPNNPGIEVDPVIGKNGKRISFQAKYFDSRIDYSQIKASFKTAVENYKGKLDVVYLYCNLDAKVTSIGYTSCESILREADIELVPVTGVEVLNQALKIGYIRTYYFGGYHIDAQWCKKITEQSKIGLGKRYNDYFNVKTDTQKAVELFCNLETAIKEINQKKEDTIAYFNKRYYPIFNGLVTKCKSEIYQLADVTIQSIEEYKSWKIYFAEIFSEIDDLLHSIEKRIESSDKNNTEKENRDSLYTERNIVYSIRNQMIKLCCSDEERKLIDNQILIINGEGGTGKSHCLCDVALKLSTMASGFLVLGTHFLTDTPAEIQLMSYIGMPELQMENLIQILHCLGKQSNRPFILFIDAINESPYRKIWSTFITKLSTIIKEYSYVKIVFSYRTGYEQMLLGHQWRDILSREEFCTYTNEGFKNNSVEAIKDFFNYYGITFTPQFYFYQDFENPLFLRMFCETFDERIADVDIISIFDRVIKQADIDVKSSIFLDDVHANLADGFIRDIAEYLLENRTHVIESKALKRLSFWKEEGLETQKLQYISAMSRTNIIIPYASGEEEYYYIGFNLLQDYIIAKRILSLCNSLDELNQYSVEKLLMVEDGEIKNANSIDVYIFLCALSREKYDFENIDVVLELIGEKDRFVRNHLFEEYVQSFEWRSVNTSAANYLTGLLQKYRVSAGSFLSILISNSLKINSKINANYLHDMLLSLSLIERDSFWTSYINEKDTDGTRIFELIDLIEHFEAFDSMAPCQKLILKLFTWILSSSNRYLRDHCSKAIVAVLTNNINLCTWILKEFESVNDPYIIQRLYGCVYGAVLRSESREPKIYEELSNYIYHTVFLSRYVYPDVLLRDYACGIINKCRYENIDLCEKITADIYQPPYGSEDLPIMADIREKYAHLKFGEWSIVHSMRPDRIPDPGAYGDFGRYIFQSTIKKFKGVDIKNAYLYARDYIFNNIGYSNDKLGEYDTNLGYYSYKYAKERLLERIGKKYEWISLYNTLSHIADNYELENSEEYKGAWQLHIRDFDPTVSKLMMDDPRAKMLFRKKEFGEEFLSDFESSDDQIVEWANSYSKILGIAKESLIIQDSNGVEWVKLCQYQDERIEEPDVLGSIFDRKKQCIWNHQFAYFVKNENSEELFSSISNLDYRGNWFPEGAELTTVFNRELYWSPAFIEQIGEEWQECEIETDETEEIVYEHSELTKLILQYSDEKDETVLLPDSWTTTVKKKRVICSVLPSYIHFNWGAEYDMSQKETTSFIVPCSEVVMFFGLKQKKFDGYFYDGNQLVAYDMNLNETGDALIIRKDYLENFLSEKGYTIFWTMIGAKEFLKEFSETNIWSEWSGFAYMDNNGEINGESRITCKAEKSSKDNDYNGM